MSSCDNFFAKPMIEADDFLEVRKEQLIEQGKNEWLDVDSKRKYKVYSLRQKQKGAHKSIVLTPNDERFLTVELTIAEFDGYKRTFPFMRPIPKSWKKKMTYLGEVEATGRELIRKAIKAMENFGFYCKPCHNCQDYCNKYVKEIGLSWKGYELTDGDRATIAGVLGAIVLGLFALFR